jgi:hypothetical protein
VGVSFEKHESSKKTTRGEGGESIEKSIGEKIEALF